MVKKLRIIGASLGSFEDLDLERGIEFYKKLSNDFNLAAVEIRFEKEENNRPALWHWEAGKIKNFLINYEIKGIHLPFVHLDPLSPNPRIRTESLNQLKEAIEKASEIEADYAVMHARSITNLSRSEALEEWKNVIEMLKDHAKAHQVLLTIENADFFHDLSDLVKIVREINSKWLRIILDIGHAHIRMVPPLSTFPVKELILRAADAFLPFLLPTKRNMPYEAYGSLKDFIRSEKDLIYGLHIHDYDGKKDHISLGEGKINFSFFSELKNFNGPYILEIEFKNHYHDFARNYKKLVELIKCQ